VHAAFAVPGARRAHRRHLVVATAVVLAASLAAAGCGGTMRKTPLAPAPSLSQLAPSDELYELSPARIHIRRLGPQALRLLAPHWSRLRESDRKMVQLTLVSTLAEARIAPFVRAELKKASDAHPDLAAAALAWLRTPIGYDVKFSEATAWSGEKSPEKTFYSDVAEIRENRMPEVRMERIRRLAAVTGALEKTLDMTEAVGKVVARLVNVAIADRKALPLATLEAEVDRERRVPAVAAAYEPVVNASLLARCRDLDLDQLDQYIDFSKSPAGMWYHDTLSAALVAGIAQASTDVEGVLDANAHSDKPAPEVGGFDLDSLLVPLPSGRTIRLLALAQSGPESEPSVLLRYETTLPLDNAAAVRSEASEVWDKLRGQIESEGATAAVLQPTGSVSGWVFPFASSRKFAWRRSEDGNWTPAPQTAGALEREMLWSVPP